MTSYDIVVPSDYMVGILGRAGLLEEIDTRQLTNFENLAPRFVGLPYDPENRYSVPYGWGTSGIGYRRDMIGRDAESWNDLWDPAFKDRVGMLNDIRENFGAALKRAGRSLNETDTAEIARAAKALEAQKPLVRTYDSDTFSDNLLSGEVWVTQSYSGQVARAILDNPDVGYAIPKEGCTMFVDNMCIPKGAPNRDLALLFLNYVLEGPVAAQFVESTGYATPNRAAVDSLPPEWRDNPAVYPPEEVLDRCELIQDLGETTEVYDRYWTEIKS